MTHLSGTPCNDDSNLIARDVSCFVGRPRLGYGDDDDDGDDDDGGGGTDDDDDEDGVSIISFLIFIL